MEIQYTDLHLEFPENREFLKKYHLGPVGEILLLAGDILPFVMLDKACEFLDWVSDNYKAVYWLPGNHE